MAPIQASAALEARRRPAGPIALERSGGATCRKEVEVRRGPSGGRWRDVRWRGMVAKGGRL